MWFVKKFPLYRKVSGKIIELINKGVFSNDILPSEDALSKMLGVSRTTVREALAELTHQGIVHKKPGIGNTIMNSALNAKYRIDTKHEFNQMIEEAGYKSKYVESYSRYEKMVINGKEAEFLVYDELLYADNNIAAIFKVHVEKNSLSREPAKDLPKNNFFEFIFDYTNEVITHSIVYFESILADKNLARQMYLDEKNPLLTWREDFFTINDVQVCHNRIYFNPSILKPTLLRNSFESGSSINMIECEIKKNL